MVFEETFKRTIAVHFSKVHIIYMVVSRCKFLIYRVRVTVKILNLHVVIFSKVQNLQHNSCMHWTVATICGARLYDGTLFIYKGHTDGLSSVSIFLVIYETSAALVGCVSVYNHWKSKTQIYRKVFKISVNLLCDCLSIENEKNQKYLNNTMTSIFVTSNSSLQKLLRLIFF